LISNPLQNFTIHSAQTDDRQMQHYSISATSRLIRTKIGAQINIKNTDYCSTHEISGVPKFQTTPFRLYANCTGRQTTRLRFITRIIYSLSRSLLQEEEHCCRPSSAYINLFHRLYSLYCANDLLRRNLLRKHNSTPCCCLDCQRLLVIRAGHRSSTAVNMTSV